MAIDSQLLEVLACPKCKGDIEYIENTENVQEGLYCDHCNLLYPIEDDIPIMLIDDAKEYNKS